MVAILVDLLQDVAGYLGVDLRVYESFGGSDPIGIDRHVALDDTGNRDFRSWRRRHRRRFLAAGRDDRDRSRRSGDGPPNQPFSGQAHEL